jgi:hypothetical protein
MIYYLAYLSCILNIAFFYTVIRQREKIRRLKDTLNIMTYGYLQAKGKE